MWVVFFHSVRSLENASIVWCLIPGRLTTSMSSSIIHRCDPASLLYASDRMIIYISELWSERTATRVLSTYALRKSPTQTTERHSRWVVLYSCSALMSEWNQYPTAGVVLPRCSCDHSHVTLMFGALVTSVNFPSAYGNANTTGKKTFLEDFLALCAISCSARSWATGHFVINCSEAILFLQILVRIVWSRCKSQKQTSIWQHFTELWVLSHYPSCATQFPSPLCE